jgi:predicted lysophospholipase L1 biosynthesis ABC-type transport system permease subunit
VIAGAIGAAGALALSWAVTKYLLDIPWRPAPALLTVGVALTAVLVAVVGVAASLDVLRKKPLGPLRAE